MLTHVDCVLSLKLIFRVKLSSLRPSLIYLMFGSGVITMNFLNWVWIIIWKKHSNLLVLSRHSQFVLSQILDASGSYIFVIVLLYMVLTSYVKESSPRRTSTVIIFAFNLMRGSFIVKAPDLRFRF